MPLVTLQTRLSNLMTEARSIKQYCLEACQAMQAGAVSANAVLQLTQRFRASIDEVVIPSQQHIGLVGYAANQFLDPNFGLDMRMAGLKHLLEVAIEVARETIPSDPVSGYLLKDIWNEDGSVSVRQLDSAITAGLCVALQTIYDNIPE